MRLRVTLSTQSESAAFRRISLISSSGDLWCGVVHDGVTSAVRLAAGFSAAALPVRPIAAL